MVTAGEAVNVEADVLVKLTAIRMESRKHPGVRPDRGLLVANGY